MQAEIDELLEIDPSHTMHFVGNKPNIEQWRKIRRQYIRGDLLDIDDGWDPHKPQWFNSLQISVFIRNPEKMTEERMEEIKNLVKEKIPGHDFEAFHVPVFHHDDVCLPGDIFKHENAKKYNDLHTIERKYPSYIEKDAIHGDDEFEGHEHEGDENDEMDNLMFDDEEPNNDDGAYELSQEEIDNLDYNADGSNEDFGFGGDVEDIDFASMEDIQNLM